MVRLLKILLVIVLVAWTTMLWGQGVDRKKTEKRLQKLEAFEELVVMVKEKPIEFVADWAYPLGYSNVDLITNPNHLRLRNDSVYMHMPYFGRAFQVTPGERGGFYAEENIRDKKMKVNERKRRIRIEFMVNGENDRYQCFIEIMGKESATLSISSNNRSSISYSGDIREWKENEN
ncbi:MULTISPECIES: DUF4251 domain-containing protein [unclassified Saccharicrinis]|uniref:DUF4251 domain-containing protein n=1 Tax=unclassified Saccharicrinis TaxID=2646859 RepID=UPI003D325C80